MKLTIIVLAIISTLCEKLYEMDEKILSMSTSSLKSRKQAFTELRPDEESNPLKLSKEQLGRFSW
jgi:hypothetical protein